MPQSEKLDLPHLRLDLPKYVSSNITSEALQWWDMFITQIEQSMDASTAARNMATTWIYQELVEVSEASQAIETTAEREGINDRLIQLRASETNNIPEVMI